MSERIIFANFDLKDFKDLESNFYNVSEERFNVLNNISETIVLGLNNNIPPAKIVFSSNGVDGIGVNDPTFQINKINYTNEKIYFVARLKSSSDYPIKNAPKLNFYKNTELYNINLSCIDVNGQRVNTSFVANFDDNETVGGYFKGYFIIDDPIDKVTLKASVLTETGIVEGQSNTFNIYSSAGLYDYRKINEDNDQTQNYKDLIFQNILLEKNNFFDNFLGTIVGNLSSNPNTLGIKTYEKISNFVANNSDIDVSNLQGFLSMINSLDIELEEFKAIFPPELLRLVDNLSVNLSKQKGQRNQFNKNFDDKGYENSNIFGINKGNQLPVMTTTLTAGADTSYIVAKENFSNTFKLLNTNIISAFDTRFEDISGTFTYKLSDYKTSWGWGLLVPENLGKRNFIKLQSNASDFLALQDGFYRLRKQDFDPIEGNPEILENFYTFYDYISTTENTYLQKYIDFDNPNTDVGSLDSYSSYTEDSGFIDNTVLNLLTQKTISLNNKIEDLIRLR